MSELFDSWSDEQVGSLLTYMLNCNLSAENYNEIETIQDELVDEAVERGLIQE